MTDNIQNSNNPQQELPQQFGELQSTIKAIHQSLDSLRHDISPCLRNAEPTVSGRDVDKDPEIPSPIVDEYRRLCGDLSDVLSCIEDIRGRVQWPNNQFRQVTTAG